MPIKEKNESLEIDNKKTSKKAISLVKKHIALKTAKILCNKEFQLIEGKEISKEINKAFLQSLIDSNLIKEIKC